MDNPFSTPKISDLTASFAKQYPSEKQIEVYKRANKTGAAITAIVYYKEAEGKKVDRVLNELGIAGSENLILIDARRDNKVSASNVK